jgi:hypothetical protein
MQLSWSYKETLWFHKCMCADGFKVHFYNQASSKNSSVEGL